MKELPIGTEIKLPFTTLKVEEVENNRIYNCNQCAFSKLCEENGKFVYESFGTCDASEREDNTNVIFKDIT